MTWNIQAGAGNLDAIAEMIREQAPDIVGLQEVDVHWSDRSSFADQAVELGRRLGMEVRFAPIYRLANADPTRPHREYGVALLSRHPVTSWRNDSLTRLSTQAAAPVPDLMPGMLEATVEVRGRRIRFFTTHLDYRADPGVRRRQVTETLAFLRQSDGPTVLVGDLNAPPEAPELQPLFQVLRDAWTAGSGAGLTYPATVPAKRIDYILVSPHFDVAVASVPATTSSDHRPVVADVILRRAPR
ncbi:MAG TPA: endonuclease/exonuclease/phosphatase family protein [Gemmatimonadaceae bacterium]|nr:endonuclease/exonuclease/phosphatase family protein [Gemmatimonadaceae bacterium]